MNLVNNVELIQEGIYFRSKKILILSDPHIGYEDALIRQGILIPRFHQKDLKEKIELILRDIDPQIIILNGDIKHEFGKISDREWRDTGNFIEFIQSRCKKIILIKGNHDKILGPILKKLNLELKDHYFFTQDKHKVYITHGDLIPDNSDFNKSNFIIIGHEHPAISIRDEIISEKYKCFLLGRFGKKRLLVQPSMNPLSEGSHVLNNEILSPFLKNNINKMNVFILGDRTYDFGKIEGLINGKPSG